MKIPRHRSVDASYMVRVLEDALGQMNQNWRLVVRADTAQHPDLLGFRWTRVPFFKIVLHGRMWLCEDAARHEPGCWLTPGDAVLFSAESYANVAFPENVRFLRVTFDEGLTVFGDGQYSVPLSPQVELQPDEPLESLSALALSGGRPRLVDELVDALGRYGRQNKAAGQAFVPGLLWSLIELLQQSAREKMISGAQRVREIIHYVEQQCGRPLTRDQVASVFEISGGHLTRLLRKVHDEGFQEMLCQLRLQQARDLLRHSTLNIEQIALRCGFTSANYFAQAFRRAEGVAPGTWRKRNVM